MEIHKMKNYIKTFIALVLFNTIGLTAMEPDADLELGAVEATYEENLGQLQPFPGELLLPILENVFFNSEILIGSENIFDAIDRINVHLSQTLINVALTCRSFFQFKNDFLMLKKELLKFYQAKLKEAFLESRENKDGLHPINGEWAENSEIAQKIALFMLNEDHLNDPILPEVIFAPLNIIGNHRDKQLKTQLIRLLIFMGADLNAKDAFGSTALIGLVLAITKRL